MRPVQYMYKDVRSMVRVCDECSEEFGVGVGVHKGSALSPLLITFVLEIISKKYGSGCPWELEFVPDLCYLGDILSAGGVFELAAITRYMSA